MAQDSGLDLVEIQPNGDPPVCRIMDFGKFKFEAQKKAHAAKKNQKQVEIKELKFRPVTDVGDYQIKMRNLRRFLEEGDKVKITIRFRGREMAYQHLGREKLLGVCDALKDCAITEGDPRMEGRMMGIVLAPSRKKPAVKPAGAPSKEGGEAAPAAESKAQVGPQA